MRPTRDCVSTRAPSRTSARSAGRAARGNRSTSPEPPRRSKSFVLKGKLLLLTYPRCSLPKADCLSRLHSLFAASTIHRPPTAAVVSQETHEDGGLHLHVALKFEEAFETRLPSFFDFLTGQHGNYKPRTSWKGTLKYITKEDSDPSLWGITAESLRRITGATPSKEKVTDQVARMCMDRVPMDQIARQNPGFAMMNYRKIQHFHTWINAPMNRELPPWPGIAYRGSDSSTAKIVLWVQANLFTKRQFKQKQLYIHGPHDFGKTSFVNSLNGWVRIYKIPPFENFYDFYDDRHDLLFYDEFKAQKQLQWMNLLLQGDDMTIPQKGSQYPKDKNMPMIMASNFTPREAYNNVSQATLDTFLCRFDSVHLRQPIDRDNIEFRQPSGSELNRMVKLADSAEIVAITEATDGVQSNDCILRIAHHGLCTICAEDHVNCRCPSRQPPQQAAASSSHQTLFSDLTYTWQSATGSISRFFNKQ